jgi:hypothetical protein
MEYATPPAKLHRNFYDFLTPSQMSWKTTRSLARFRRVIALSSFQTSDPAVSERVAVQLCSKDWKIDMDGTVRRSVMSRKRRGAHIIGSLDAARSAHGFQEKDLTRAHA